MSVILFIFLTASFIIINFIIYKTIKIAIPLEL